MTPQEILEGLAAIVSDETGLAAEAVQLDKSFRTDLDVDSLSMMSIVVEAEDRFGVSIPDSDAGKLRTVGDAVNYIVAAQESAS
jgi:acyl carrier protein